MKRYIARGLILLIVIFAVGSTIYSHIEESRCEYGTCKNKKAGKHYCPEHSCAYDNCEWERLTYSHYCYAHSCRYTDGFLACQNPVVKGRHYCEKHYCSYEECNQPKVKGTNYCTWHQIDMTEFVGIHNPRFKLNSASGIDTEFSVSNWSDRTVKYVIINVSLQNAVGDKIKADFKNTNIIEIEVIGPIEPHESKTFSDIIGYCDNLDKMTIQDVTVIYTDGSKITGDYWGSFSKKN